MGRRDRDDRDELDEIDDDATEDERVAKGKKKRKAWPRGRRRKEQQEREPDEVSPGELDPLWEVRAKR